MLGMGGARILHALGFKISAYHMNEGHSALLGVELLRRNTYPPEDAREGESPYDLPRVRELCRFTAGTHEYGFPTTSVRAHYGLKRGRV